MSEPKRALYKRFADGTVLPNSASLTFLATRPANESEKAKARRSRLTSELEKALKPSPSQMIALKKLTADLKSIFIDSVRDSDQSAALQSRLRTLTFDFDGAECSPLQPDAKYSPDSNSVSVCKSIHNYPIASLIPILAHEIAHATDPCQFDELIFDEQKAKEIDAGNFSLLRRCGFKGEISQTILSRIRSVNESSEVTILPDAPFAWAYFTCGLAKPRLDNRIAIPWSKVAECTDRIGGASKKRNASLTEMVNFESKMLGDSFTGKAIIPTTPTSGNLSCDSISREGYADHVGAELTAKYLTFHPLRQEQRSELLWYLTHINCFRPPNAGASYPEPATRISAFLQYPEVQRELDCEDADFKAFCSLDTAANKSSPAREVRRVK